MVDIESYNNMNQLPEPKRSAVVMDKNEVKRKNLEKARETKKTLATNRTKNSPFRSKSAKGGLIFPVNRIRKNLKNNHPNLRVNETAAFYMAAVMEYLTAEILDLAGIVAMNHKHQRITPKHINLAIKTDSELNYMLKDVVVSQGGIVPFIHPELLFTKSSRKKSTSQSQEEIEKNRAQDDDLYQTSTNQSITVENNQVIQNLPSLERTDEEDESEASNKQFSSEDELKSDDESIETLLIEAYLASSPQPDQSEEPVDSDQQGRQGQENKHQSQKSGQQQEQDQPSEGQQDQSMQRQGSSGDDGDKGNERRRKSSKVEHQAEANNDESEEEEDEEPDEEEEQNKRSNIRPSEMFIINNLNKVHLDVIKHKSLREKKVVWKFLDNLCKMTITPAGKLHKYAEIDDDIVLNYINNFFEKNVEKNFLDIKNLPVFEEQQTEEEMTETDEETSEKEDKGGKGKQGLASTPKEKVRAIASKGGKSSHKQGTDHEDTPKKVSKGQKQDKSKSGERKIGFAGMAKDKHRKASTLGGQHSHMHLHDHPQSQESTGGRKRSSSGKGKQGFASMPREKVQEIGRKGGKNSHIHDAERMEELARETQESEESEPKPKRIKSSTKSGWRPQKTKRSVNSDTGSEEGSQDESLANKISSITELRGNEFALINGTLFKKYREKDVHKTPEEKENLAQMMIPSQSHRPSQLAPIVLRDSTNQHFLPVSINDKQFIPIGSSYPQTQEGAEVQSQSSPKGPSIKFGLLLEGSAEKKRRD